MLKNIVKKVAEKTIEKIESLINEENTQNKCVGCGICANIFPEGIEIVGGKARIKDGNVGCCRLSWVNRRNGNR